MLVALLDQFFENYTTFSLSVLYQKKKKKKRTKSKLCICFQLNMKSSSFWDTYLLLQNIINHWIQDKKQWLVVSKCKFLFAAILLAVKAGIINDAIFTTCVPSPLENERFYTAIALFFQDIENLKIDMIHGPNLKIIDLGDQTSQDSDNVSFKIGKNILIRLAVLLSIIVLVLTI